MSEAIGTILGRLLVRVARAVWFLAVRPTLTLPLTVALVLGHMWVTAGAGVQFCTGLAAPAVVLGWRRWHRPSYAVGVRWARTWWLRWVRYGVLWAWWMGRSSLTLTDEKTGNAVRPRLIRVASTPSVDRLLVRLPAGMTPDDVRSKRDALAHATGATEARVKKHKPRHIWLELERRNPLKCTIPAIPVPTGKHALDVRRLDRLIIGYADDGTPWRLRVRGNHIFIGGATGSGKGSVIQSVLQALAPFIRAGLVQVWAIDPKGGMELEFGAPLYARYERDGWEGMVKLLETGAEVMDERCRTLRGKTRKFTPSVETPLVLILIDELATLTALLPDRSLSARAENALGLLLTKGRAPGFCVMAAVQDVTKAVCVWRDLFPTRVALRLSKALEVDMVVGDGAYDAGAYCDELPESCPGMAYVKVEGKAEPVRVRAAFVTDEDIIATAAEYRPDVVGLVTPAAEQPDTNASDVPVSVPVPVRELVPAGAQVVPGEVTVSVRLGKNTENDNRPARGPATSRPPRKPRKPRKPRAPRATATARQEDQ